VVTKTHKRLIIKQIIERFVFLEKTKHYCDFFDLDVNNWEMNFLKMEIQHKDTTFMSVIENHKGILYKVANAYCKDSDDRNDLVQEITIQLWKSFDHYNSAYKYSTWIYRIALNVAISFIQKENRRKNRTHPLNDSIFDFTETTVTNETEQNINLLQQFVSELKELDKALMLLYLEEKSHKEIAEIMGISETNVATKIGRIKTSLKQKFSLIKNY
jgi:RNA polymerase sigma factor (sigma-70 family)